ncbi:MAG: ribosome maturation factor RimP [Candidatus Lambdaproteobacteria bacterium]|nr:ribosome maturation factor RimP [Candidatus Lambdaproteobacteria bacterium]
MEQLLQRPIAGLGYELLEVQYRHEGRWMLRLVIDGPRGVDLDACGAVSELAGRVLDVEDPIPQKYALEVTSPGLFRPLTSPRHFAQSVGKVARMQLAPGVLPERKNRTLRGKIEGLDGEDVLIDEIGGNRLRLPQAALKSARLDPDL